MRLIIGICALYYLATITSGQVPFMNLQDLMADDEQVPTCE